jgi:hypothetical protein
MLDWEPRWKEVCDGKRLFADLQRKGVLKIGISDLKRKVIQRMKDIRSENWELVEAQLRDLISEP